MNGAEFYDMLDSHDWHFAMSDDARSFRKGQQEAARLAKIATSSDELSALMASYRRFVFSGPRYGCPKRPKPDRPMVVSTFPGSVPAVHPAQSTLF